MQYDNLEQLNRLRQQGAITEEEYQREKAKILNNRTDDTIAGMHISTYCMLMHLSQFCGYLIPVLGLAVPVIMWAIQKDNDWRVDRHGKIILNWLISLFIYAAAAAILSFCLIGIPVLIALAICHIVFVIIAAIKANNGEAWNYPLSIPFIRFD